MWEDADRDTDGRLRAHPSPSRSTRPVIREQSVNTSETPDWTAAYVTNGAQRGALSSRQSNTTWDGVVGGATAAARRSNVGYSARDELQDDWLLRASGSLSTDYLRSALSEVDGRIARLRAGMSLSSSVPGGDKVAAVMHDNGRCWPSGAPERHNPSGLLGGGEVAEEFLQRMHEGSGEDGAHRPTARGHVQRTSVYGWRDDGWDDSNLDRSVTNGGPVAPKTARIAVHNNNNAVDEVRLQRSAVEVSGSRSNGVRPVSMHSSNASLYTVSDLQLSRESNTRRGGDVGAPQTDKEWLVDHSASVSADSAEEGVGGGQHSRERGSSEHVTVIRRSYNYSPQRAQRKVKPTTDAPAGRRVDVRRRSEGEHTDPRRRLDHAGMSRHGARSDGADINHLAGEGRRAGEDGRRRSKEDRRRGQPDAPRRKKSEEGRDGGRRCKRATEAGGSSPSSGDDSGSEKSRRGRGDRRDGDARRRHSRKKHRSGDAPSSSERSGSESCSRQSASHKRWLKPEKFDGRGSLETFLYMFENCASYNRWRGKDKTAYLRWSLTGIAAQLLWGTSELTYDELIEKLRGRFGGKGMEEKFQNELRYRRRAKGESLRELAQDIRRLMALAYPGEKSSLAEHIARDSFLCALDDPEFELKIREQEPPDLDAAVKTALRFEVFRGAVEAASSGRHRVSRQVIRDNSEGNLSDEFGSRLCDIERRLENLSRASQSPIDGSSQPTPGKADDDVVAESRAKVRRNRNVSSVSKKQEKERAPVNHSELLQSARTNDERVAQLLLEKEALNKEVERLRLLEHARKTNDPSANAMVRTQPEPKSEATMSTTPRATGGCWTCGAPGHFSRNCQFRSQMPRQGSAESGVPFQCMGTRKCFEDGYKSATYLRAVISNQERDCLLDTGSEISLLPASIVDRSLISSTSHTLKAANGTSIPVLGQATVPIRVGHSTSTVRGLVSDHIAEVMLGIEWLTENRVVWDFNSSTIRFNGEYITLQAVKKEQKWCRRTVLHHEVTIPPRSQMNLPTKVVFNRRPDTVKDACWVTESSPIVKGVYVARTVIPSERYTDIPVRVVNTQPCPVTLGAGMFVSNLSPSSVIANISTTESKVKELHADTDTQSNRNVTPAFIETLIDSVDHAVPPNAIARLKQLLLKHEEVFSTSEYDMGLTDAITHRIDTGDAKPVRQPLRRHPPAHVEAITEHIDKMLKQGVIEPAASPWASNIVLVRKKDSTYRCCIDYRQLNAVTTRDAYPLPRIDVCLDTMAGAKWFSTFDLRSSYHQVRVAPEDTDKTAFICPHGMYKFRTMPFGLVNAGATFQRLMDVLMTGLNLDICLVYLDDIVVFSATIEQHLERLEAVLTRLKSAGLKLKPEKSAILQKSVSFLGHMISDAGVGTDPAKTRTVMDWPSPKSLKEVRAFVGLASYYRRFVRDFARIAAPLHDLMKKGSAFIWSPEAQRSFDELKQALTSPPILAMPMDTGEFLLDTDASDGTIGAVLSQRQDGVERVIAYASRSLDRRERNYCVTRKELLAVVHFMRYFKQYILGRHFTVRTDHAALTWLRKTPDPIGQQARWLEQMEEFSFTVEHRSGTRHGNADALSRRPCRKTECACHSSGAEPDIDVLQGGAPAFGGPADRPTLHYSTNDRTDPPSDVTEQSTDDGAKEVGSKLQCRVTVIADVHPTPSTFPEMMRCADNCDCMLIAATNRGSTQPKVSQEDTNDASNAQHSRPAPVTKTSGPSPDTVLPWSLEGLRTEQRKDEVVGTVICLLEESPQKPDWDTIALKDHDVKVLWASWPRLAIRDGLLKRRFEEVNDGGVRWQVVVPKALRQEFMSIAHGGMTGGHLGRQKTAAAIKSRAYWPTWSSDLDTFLKRCADCSRYHRGSLPRRAPMQTPLVGEPWERVSVDITGPHPKSSRGNRFIITVVDHFSKWAEAIPVANHTAPVVARVLMNHVFTRFGTPLQLLTDRGPEFESELFTQLMRWMEIDKLRTTAYKPSTNGVVERFHRTLNSMLGKMVSDSQRDWDDQLPLVMAAYRASPHSSTGFSPNRLFLGRENRMPLDLVMGLSTNESNGTENLDEYVAQMEERAREAYGYAREQLQVAAERRKTDYDIRVKQQKFNVGEWVWYYYPRRYRGKSPKWQKNYVGPYLVVRVIEPSNYVLQKSSKANPFVVHVDKIKRCYGHMAPNWVTAGESQDDGSDHQIERPRADTPAVRRSSPANHDPTASGDATLIAVNERDNHASALSESTEVNGRPLKRKCNRPKYLTDFVCNYGQ